MKIYKEKVNDKISVWKDYDKDIVCVYYVDDKYHDDEFKMYQEAEHDSNLMFELFNGEIVAIEVGNFSKRRFEDLIMFHEDLENAPKDLMKALEGMY